MATVTVDLSEEQLARLIEAYRTIEEFLVSALSPEEIYTPEFLAGLRESDDDISDKRWTEVRGLDDFTS